MSASAETISAAVLRRRLVLLRKARETLALGTAAGDTREALASRGVAPGSYSVAPVTARDLDELLALMRSYCEFYETAPGDEALLDLARALLADPDTQGVQLIARDERSLAAGFATLFWSWDTTEARQIAIMHDLFVAPHARGQGVAEQLIGVCVELCRQRGAMRLDWQTGPENLRAQAVYDRIGGVREPWLLYTLPVS